MKNKVVICSLLVCLLLATITGCREEEKPTQTTSAGEESVLIIDGANEGSDLVEGKFETSRQSEGKTSDAEKLGGSSTLDIEYSKDETMPGDDSNASKEPQWLPGIW